MPVVVTGLKELRAELRAAADATPREITAALKEGSGELAVRARELAPKNTGKMASTIRPFATVAKAGVRSNHPGAGVQEFAITYYRQPAGSGGSGSRALKRHIRKGHTSAAESGLVEVHMVNVSAPGPSGGRFAWKAVDELGPELAVSTFERLLSILRCHGWFG